MVNILIPISLPRRLANHILYLSLVHGGVSTKGPLPLFPSLENFSSPLNSIYQLSDLLEYHIPFETRWENFLNRLRGNATVQRSCTTNRRFEMCQQSRKIISHGIRLRLSITSGASDCLYMPVALDLSHFLSTRPRPNNATIAWSL